ncbi:hypothetical protein [Chitinimonas sp.]|uniref:hypothetical protein n=1 Tax=Chitinimonas sp. TaxID=1934313 RepID=UPI0035AD7ED9
MIGRPTSRNRGERLKERGQQLALDFAGADWGTLVVRKLREFIAAKGYATFPIEEFREWALADGLPAPASHFAWGAVPKLARSAGLIVWTGQYIAARSEKTHAHPVKLWRAA